MLIMLAESRHRRCKLSRHPANAGLYAFEQARLQIAPGRRALGGRAAVVVQGCKERQLACLYGSGGGQLRAPQVENVLPAVKFAVDENEGGTGHDCASCGCK